MIDIKYFATASSAFITWYNICIVHFYFTGYSTVFVKDMAYYLVNRLDNADLLPKNYIHTFLLRDPKKSVYSLYKMSLNKELTGERKYDS